MPRRRKRQPRIPYTHAKKVTVYDLETGEWLGEHPPYTPPQHSRVVSGKTPDKPGKGGGE